MWLTGTTHGVESVRAARWEMMDYEGEMKVREREKHLILSPCICPHYLQELSKRGQARQEIEACREVKSRGLAMER